MQQKIIAFVCVFEFGLRFMKEKLKLCPLALYRHSVTKKHWECPFIETDWRWSRKWLKTSVE